MFYKLSITSEIEQIEHTFNAKFKYPLLFEKDPIINGLQEQSVPIIRSNNLGEINFAIWGILPKHYREDWEDFQTLNNTLNTDIQSLEQCYWISKVSETNRCAILTSGFFTSYMYDGEVFPFYVYRKDKQPFALAGIYTKLDDGFFTTSILLSHLKNTLTDIHNIGESLPVVLDERHTELWLKGKGKLTNETFMDFNVPKLKAHPISKEFFKNNIIYDDILKPAHYQKLPLLSLK